MADALKSLLYAALLLSLASPGNAQENRSPSADLADLVRAEYDGDRAYETVAYLDQFVRWPGNRGFDASIDHIAARLEAAGFVREEVAENEARLTYRIETYAMDVPAWEPLDASLSVIGAAQPLLHYSTNRNMLARRSESTADKGVTADLVDAGAGTAKELDATNVAGNIVLVEGALSEVFERAVIERGAIGILVYSMPDYLQPAKNIHSIQFRGIAESLDGHGAWAISLSRDARDQLRQALNDGDVRVNVNTRVLWTQEAFERTVVADIRGSMAPVERFVFSAHVQEPGANDNASGVGAQLEMASVAAKLLRQGKVDPQRSVTFLWGDEIVSTRRYVSQDKRRTDGILWGMSLDMVGEDTAKTGGTFLIEKMPDPSAIWTRGEDRHSEWGGDELTLEDMTPHYFNDVVFGRAQEQAATNGWVVKTNPFEGGSDHVPFLEAGIPGLLLWHFTDQFYHTDRDRLDKVSSAELKNVGVTALVTGLALASADGHVAQGLVAEVLAAAKSRLGNETKLGAAEIGRGGSVELQRDIINAWADWYSGALDSMDDIQVGGSSPATGQAIEAAAARLELWRSNSMQTLGM